MTSHFLCSTSMASVAALLLLFSGTSLAVSSNSNNSVSQSNNNIVSLPLTPHHVARRRRKLSAAADDASELDDEQYRRREDAVQVGALFEGYGTHYIDLWCGSPPQRQTVIVDTGSGVTAFPCSGCDGCGSPDYHVNKLFIEADSSTFKESKCSSNNDCIMSRSNCQHDTCKIGMSYAEGSRWNAYEAVDKCYVAGPHETPLMASNPHMDGEPMNPKHAADLAFDMTFGCQTLVTGLFKTQLADGIMGMSNQMSTFWSQMFRAEKMGDEQKFALCFSRPPLIKREGTEAGAMTLGGFDQRLHSSPMVFTPDFDKGRSSFFSVKIRSMMLRDGKFGMSAKSTSKNPNEGVKHLQLDESVLNKGGIIVDSGTTDTYWNIGIKSEFNRLFQEMAGRPHSNSAISLTDEELEALPTILLQLYGDPDKNNEVGDFYKTAGLAGALDSAFPHDVILAIPPSHYMEYNAEKGLYTSRFYPTERSGSVLGANAMMGHDVFFDMETKRVGWAESSCDYTQTVKDNGFDFDITGNLESKVQEADEGDNAGKPGGGHSNNGNKHSTNGNNNDANKNNASKNNAKKDNGDHFTPEDEEYMCSTISSGTKCQKIDFCHWGFGKCSRKEGEHDPAVETDSPTEFPTDMPTEFEPEGLVESVLAKIDGDNGVFVGAGIGGLLILVICGCCYCMCCRSSRKSTAKYTAGPTIEMTNGHSNGFQDEPDDDFDDEEVSDHNGLSSKQFRDSPDSEPEFEGDFA